MGCTLQSATAVFLEATTDNSACNEAFFAFSDTRTHMCLATYFSNDPSPFYRLLPKDQMLIVMSSMTLCTMMSVRAMPVHEHCRPNQPDDVLTFSKNHLCVYKELPLLHNRLMHISASAWIFGSKSNRLTILYLLLRRHWRRALFGPSLHLGFLPTRCAL